MKNPRNQQDQRAVMNAKSGRPQPTSQPDYFTDELSELEEQVFANQPAPRIPETSEEENFRLLIKSHLSSTRASNTLLQRIKHTIQENRR